MMATITIKDIPDELYAALKETAKSHRRSINSEVIYCIEQAVRSRRIDVEATLARARELRALTAGHPITDEEFNEAKRRGRL
jgi:antitoxin FitA